MAVSFAGHLMSGLDQLRFEPLPVRLRGEVGGQVVIDSTRALLVWEPRRISPSYAVPVSDVRAELLAGDQAEAVDAAPAPVLHPGFPFDAHSTPGTRLDVRTADGRVLTGAAFQPDDPEMAETVLLDFAAIDRWLEEEAEAMGHPRNPFHRIDVRPVSRHVEVRLGGQTLATSDRALVLSETLLPNRYYFPRDDVRMDLLEQSDHRTTCAYKGHATHWSVRSDPEGDSIAWSYDEPLHDAVPVAGALAFYNERVDILVDGEPAARPRTPWARARGRA